MRRKLALVLTALLWGTGSLAIARPAHANTPLTRAVIQLLRNDVDLIPEGRSARPAEVSDRMTPGDALSTARQSFAELRFNDGSLARVGERVLFRFVPNTRTFRLDNGTMLLLIPPGQGRTRIQTPNATAGIRGSALFVRYIEGTDTTLVGALTDSGIEVFNEDETQRYELKAGNMAVVVEGRIEQVYMFDLNEFYETSELVSGLNLDSEELYASREQVEGEGIVQVQVETLEALSNHSFPDGDDVIEAPAFIQLSSTLEDLEAVGISRYPVNSSDGVAPPVETTSGPDSSNIDRVLDSAEFQDRITNPDRVRGDRPPASEPNNRPDQPDNRPDNRPDNGPNRPGNRPDNRPDNGPNRPGNRPDNRPDNGPNRPGNRPDNRPDQPGNRPDVPPGLDDNPGNRPDVPPGLDDDGPDEPGGGGPDEPPDIDVTPDDD